MTETRKLRVFLCHSSQDKPIVRELYQRLNAEGWIDPWLDEEKLLPGQDWDMEIEKAVEATDIVILCLTNSSVTKEGFVQKEIRKVLDISDHKPEGALFIIPMRLENCEPPRRLASWHYVDYFPAKRRNISYNRLLQSLKIRYGRIDPPKKRQTFSTLVGLIFLCTYLACFLFTYSAYLVKNNKFFATGINLLDAIWINYVLIFMPFFSLLLLIPQTMFAVKDYRIFGSKKGLTIAYISMFTVLVLIVVSILIFLDGK